MEFRSYDVVQDYLYCICRPPHLSEVVDVAFSCQWFRKLNSKYILSFSQ